jgi:hypothetical protein
MCRQNEPINFIIIRFFIRSWGFDIIVGNKQQSKKAFSWDLKHGASQMSKGSKVEVDRKISKMIFRAPLQLILIDPNRPYLVIFRWEGGLIGLGMVQIYSIKCFRIHADELLFV